MLWTSPDIEPLRLLRWRTAAPKAVHLMGFNEPDVENPVPTQSVYMDPATAAQAWMKYIQPHGTDSGGQARLVSPAVSNGPKGLPWLKDFLAECGKLGCQIDAVSYHWYDSPLNLPYFQKYLWEIKEVAGDRPLWLTEFAAVGGSIEEETEFIKKVLPWMDGLGSDVLERYAYYGAMAGKLINDFGDGLSNQGLAYVKTTGISAALT